MRLLNALVLSLVLLSTSCSMWNKTYTAEEQLTENTKIEKFFETEFKKYLMRSPMSITYVGGRERYDELDDGSYESAAKEVEMSKESLKALKKFKYGALNHQNKISYDLYKKSTVDGIKKFKYYYHGFRVSQMFGHHSRLPSFMINMHQIANEKEAMAYVSRLNAFERSFDQLIVTLKKQEEMGIKMPNFSFDKVIRDSQNIISGYPFTKNNKNSALYADLKRKLSKIKISSKKRKAVLKKAVAAMKTSVKPAYTKFITHMTALKERSPDNHGLWSQPNGKKMYKLNLAKITTTDMTAPEIHKLGLSEVARIHGEMRDIMKKVKFKGDLQAFFKFIQTDKRFQYPSTTAGRKQYLKDTNTIIANMKSRLDELFIIKPKADLIVKAVEKFREKSAGIAFYQGPSLDGKRPGTYYVNLSDMSSVAKYDMEALAYHEAIPGHHMQISIATELKGIPTFRKFGGYTAYSEGWGLYAELVPREIGLYQDPYSDFGRLSMELWRACRLVVDTGLHHYKWTREKGIKYLTDNTPSSQDEIVKGVERYIVMPGQATAYKIGQLKILSLRAKAKKALGSKFNIKEFHDEILKNGALPLNILEKQIDLYIASKSAA